LVLGLVAGLVGSWAGAARAGGRNEAILADLDGDQVADKAVLVDPGGDVCAVDFYKGDGAGGYAAPVRYLNPRSSFVGAPICPDMGVAVDLGGDGTVELVVTGFFWYDGVQVLSGFRPVAGYAARILPSWIGTADFDGDGLQDVYLWTDEGEGFWILYDQPDGSLSQGPVYCRGVSIHSSTQAVADFNRDGASDVAILQANGGGEQYGCGAPLGSDGVSVFYPRDGRRQDIALSAPQTIGAADVSGDRVADLTVTTTAGTVRHWIGGQDLLRPAPTAVDDAAAVQRHAAVTIPVLANDAATLQAAVAIAHQPARGSVRVNPDRTVTYVSTGRTGTWRFTYRVSEDGLSSVAAVTVTVTR
jgi:hypothetical protein